MWSCVRLHYQQPDFSYKINQEVVSELQTWTVSIKRTLPIAEVILTLRIQHFLAKKASVTLLISHLTPRENKGWFSNLKQKGNEFYVNHAGIN